MLRTTHEQAEGMRECSNLILWLILNWIELNWPLLKIWFLLIEAGSLEEMSWLFHLPDI